MGQGFGGKYPYAYQGITRPCLGSDTMVSALPWTSQSHVSLVGQHLGLGLSMEASYIASRVHIHTSTFYL